MQIVLHEEILLNSDGSTRLGSKVTASCTDGKLTIYSCDTGSSVKHFYEDSGVEYWMTVDKANLNQLSLVLHV